MVSLYDYHNTTGCKLQQIGNDSRADENQQLKQITVPEKNSSNDDAKCTTHDFVNAKLQR